MSRFVPETPLSPARLGTTETEITSSFADFLDSLPEVFGDCSQLPVADLRCFDQSRAVADSHHHGRDSWSLVAPSVSAQTDSPAYKAGGTGHQSNEHCRAMAQKESNRRYQRKFQRKRRVSPAFCTVVAAYQILQQQCTHPAGHHILQEDYKQLQAEVTKLRKALNSQEQQGKSGSSQSGQMASSRVSWQASLKTSSMMSICGVITCVAQERGVDPAGTCRSDSSVQPPFLISVRGSQHLPCLLPFAR
jgi:hypothetical protein